MHQLDTRAHLITRHVVQQHHIRTGSKRDFDLIPVVALDLYLHSRWRSGPRPPNGERDVSGDGRQVFVLDQHRCAQIMTMIRPAAAPNRISLQRTQPGCRLACVQYLRLRAAHRIHEVRRERGDTR